MVVLGPLPWCEVSKKIGIRKIVHRKKVRIISPVRKDKIVKARNESEKTNFMTDVVQEYLKAPLVSMLPQPSFASSSSVHLEEGTCQMSEVVTEMSNQALLDQGFQGSRKNAWKRDPVKTVIPKKRWEKEEDKSGNILFNYPEFFDLPYDQ